MRSMKYGIFLLSIVLFSTSYAEEPKNLDLIKNELIRYHNSGEYHKEQKKVIDQAMQYLTSRIAATQNQKKLAIILDIDETSLSNFPDMLNMSFGGTFKDIVEAEGKGTDPVIQPTLALYQYAKNNNVAVFFVTGRTENYREGTAKNLKEVGFKNWDGLILKPENYHKNTAAHYKINVRKQIENQGYRIVLNIGDQQSDLIGGYAEKTFKMPNPYYIVP